MARVVGQIIENHPKFVDRWAKRFIAIYRAADKQTAIDWAQSFLNKDAIKPVSQRAKELLGKKD